MATLYFTPTSCGAATYIAAKAAGVEFKEANVVSLADHKVVKNGQDFYKVNPKGNVPTIVLESGKVLNENVGTLLYVGKKGKNVLGKSPEDEYLVGNTLGFLASEVHKSFGPLFYYKGEPDGRKPLEEKLKKQLAFLEKDYFGDDQKFLVGDSFTVADSYLYVILHWPGFLKLDISEFTKLAAFKERVAALDFVKAAHEEMNKLAKDQQA